MKHSKRAGWIVRLASGVAAVAALVVGLVQAPALAANGQPDATLYVVESCTECGGTHTGDSWSVGLGAIVATGGSDYVNLTIKNTNPDAVSAEREGDYLLVTALAPGEAHLTITADNATTIPCELDIEVKSVSDPAQLPSNYVHTDLTRFGIEFGDEWGGLSDFWISTIDGEDHSFSELALGSDSEVPEIGESVLFGNGKTYTLTGWEHDKGTLSPDAIPAESDFVLTGGAFSKDSDGNSELLHFYDCTFTAQWVETQPEPWDENGNLLPYTIKDGVLTFDGRPDLGEWYQLDLELGEGVTSQGLIAGGSTWTMTISADSLDPSDPLYSRTGYVDGPFFVRGDNNGAYTSLLVSYPEDKALSRELVGSGTLGATGGNGVLLVQLSAPSTLKLSVANETVVTNEQGASIAHTPNDDELGSDAVWSSLTLVTEHIGGNVAQDATNSVVAVVDGVTGHPYVYDIHLRDLMGNVFEVPEGDSVTVTLPIPEGLSAEGLRVFHVADDGTVTDMNATVDAEAGTVSFTTTHFSTFVIAQVSVEAEVEQQKPAGGQGTVVKPDDEPTTPGAGSEPQSDDGEKTDGLAQTGDVSALPALLAATAGATALLGSRALRRRK